MLAIAVAALVLASGSSIAQTGPAAPAKPLGPGGIRVTTRVPEPDNWIEQKNANGTQRVYKCKPLACPDQETVSFIFSKSPTRNPNPEALEKFAKVDLPKSIRAAAAAREVLTDGTEKIETLVSANGDVKGYPSVVNESKLTRGEALSYIHTAIIFAGPLMIRDPVVVAEPGACAQNAGPLHRQHADRGRTAGAAAEAGPAAGSAKPVMEYRR